VTLALRIARAASEEFEAAVQWYENQRTGLGALFSMLSPPQWT